MWLCRVSVHALLFAIVTAGASPLSLAGQLPSSLHLTTVSPEVKIVGGEEVVRGEVPYLVSLKDVRWTPSQPRHFCGGAIHDAATIITAAHCVGPFLKNYFGVEVVAGEHQHSLQEGSEQILKVKEIILHPGFDSVTYENDIAVIKLAEHLHFNDFVQPISQPSEGKALEGECMVAGWGPVQEGGEYADVPYKATVPVWSHDDCSNTLAGVFNVAEHMVCAGYEEGGTGACESDSGSPLTCYANEAPYLGGVVSWQFGCSRPFHPTIYTNMVYFSHWVKQIS